MNYEIPKKMSDLKKDIRSLTLCCVVLISISPVVGAQSVQNQVQVGNGYQVKEKEALALYGVLTQGSLLKGKVRPGFSLKLDGERIKVTEDGYFVIGFGRDAKLSHHLEVYDLDVLVVSKVILLAERVYPTQSITGVPQKMVTPDPEKLARIKRETSLVKEARKTDSKHLYFLQKFIAPMQGQVTGVYGSRRIFNGTPKRPHYGLDYAGPVGTLVYAPADGVVSLTHDDMYYSGGTLIVDHGYGVSSTFIHLSELLVEPGQVIKQGEAIAKVGSGGRSTGPHLDWRVNWYDVRIDPQLVLKANK
jgi:murein DD-endopeptidase MepM/ murein hydrolase activator NlpD